MNNNPFKSLFKVLFSILLITIMLNMIILAAIKLDSIFWLITLCLIVPLILTTIIGVKQFKRFNLFISQISTNLNLKNLLYELLEESSRLQTRDELYHLILQKAISALPNANKGSILELVDQRFTFKAAIGFDLELLKTISLKKEETYLYKETNGTMDRTIIIYNSADYNNDSTDEENLRLLCVPGMKDINTTINTPIHINGMLWGMINADSDKKNAFNEDDIKSLEIFAFEVEKIIKIFDSLEANQYLLNHDVLTQICNRRYFNKEIESYIEIMNEEEKFCLISLDLNELKRINDSYGHHQGDRLLIHFVNAIKRHLRTNDVFARYGGDEFLILLKDTTSDLAYDILRKTEMFLELEGLVIGEHIELITFSYGIVEYPIDGIYIHQLLRNADKKMYEDKQRKRAYYLKSQLENWNEKLD